MRTITINNMLRQHFSFLIFFTLTCIAIPIPSFALDKSCGYSVADFWSFKPGDVVLYQYEFRSNHFSYPMQIKGVLMTLSELFYCSPLPQSVEFYSPGGTYAYIYAPAPTSPTFGDYTVPNDDRAYALTCPVFYPKFYYYAVRTSLPVTRPPTITPPTNAPNPDTGKTCPQTSLD